MHSLRLLNSCQPVIIYVLNCFNIEANYRPSSSNSPKTSITGGVALSFLDQRDGMNNICNKVGRLLGTDKEVLQSSMMGTLFIGGDANRDR